MTQTESSIIRYPGGKYRAVQIFMDIIPEDIKVIVSPFIGGGCFEINLVRRGIQVYGYDAFAPLVNFWQCALSNPGEIADIVNDKYYPSTREKDAYDNLFKTYYDIKGKAEQAAAFYALNRNSFSGLTLARSGRCKPPLRLTLSDTDRLRQFKCSGLQVELADFRDSIAKHPDDFLYLDPPYEYDLVKKGGLYGDDNGKLHLEFDHESLGKILKQRDNWMLSYNDCQAVRDRYKGYQILEPSWAYGMRAGDSYDNTSSEVLIMSKDRVFTDKQLTFDTAFVNM